MNYACLKNQQFAVSHYHICPIRVEDMLLIKEWRNEQMEILRQHEVLTDNMQKRYFQNQIMPSFALSRPAQILFSYFKDEGLIGYGGIVHINWDAKEGEVSFLVETNRAKSPREYEADFTCFLKLIKEVAFHELHFQKLSTETFDIRPQHISILESMGFIQEKRLKNWVSINDKPIDALIHGCKLDD